MKTLLPCALLLCIMFANSCITINYAVAPNKPPNKTNETLNPQHTQSPPTKTGIIAGKYLRKADTALNGVCTDELPQAGIEITELKGSYFSARYYNIDNNSRFEGHLYAGGVVYIVQNHPDNDYIAVYCGQVTPTGNHVKGTFYDMKGNDGDFEWILQKQ